MTASGSDEIRAFDNGLQFCMVDETTLKTIVRSNPGYVLIKNGTIIGKWSKANLPDDEWFTGNIAGKQIEELSSEKDRLYLFITIFITSILLVIIYRQYMRESKTNN